jgi:hypothetical protein
MVLYFHGCKVIFDCSRRISFPEHKLKCAENDMVKLSQPIALAGSVLLIPEAPMLRLVIFSI